MEWVQFVAALVLLAGNFYFVAVEFSVTNARPTMVDDLVRDGVAGSRSLKHAVDHIDNYLSACQLGITICSIGLGITAEPVVRHAFEGWFGDGALLGVASTSVAFVLAYALVSAFHVVLGELAPKSLAIARTRHTGLVLVPPMRVFYLATKPIVDALNWLGNLVLRPFGIPPASEAEEEVYTESELLSVMASSRRRGAVGSAEVRYAQAAFTFGDRQVRALMVPRAQVATVGAHEPLRDALGIVARSGHRRLPLCERADDLDSVIGLVTLNDLACAVSEGADGAARDYLRPVHTTADVTLADDLLGLLRERDQQLAVVVDEHGTALGIVTIEDIVEQIVGEIRDEFDAHDDEPIEAVDGRFRIGGSAHVPAVAHAVGFVPGEHHEATIGGLLTERLGHVPHPGESVEIDGVELVAEAVDGALVVEITARRASSRGDEDR